MRRRPVRGLSVLAALSFSAMAMFTTGCTSIRTEADAAPRSSVPRENALSLAHLMARSVNGEVFTIAATGSMKPTLDESSVVTVERVEFTKLQRGDIIIYKNGHGLPIIHRLYEKHGDRWLVLGDNNGAIDAEAVTETNFQGRVCAIFYTSSGGTLTNSAALAAR